MLASELTDEQKEDFCDHFYNECWNLPYEPDDRSPMPWGCPWLHGSPILLLGGTPQEMAEIYWDGNFRDIREVLQDEYEDRCCGGRGCMRCLGFCDADFF